MFMCYGVSILHLFEQRFLEWILYLFRQCGILVFNFFIYILLTFYLHMYLEGRKYGVSCSETPTKVVKEI
jgi:hypothetical protein